MREGFWVSSFAQGARSEIMQCFVWLWWFPYSDYTACQLLSEYPKHFLKVLAINSYFSIMSQQGTRVNRLPPAGCTGYNG